MCLQIVKYLYLVDVYYLCFSPVIFFELCQIYFEHYKSNTTGATCGARTTNYSRASGFTSGFSEVRVAQSLVFCVLKIIVCYFAFFLWSLYCLSLLDLQFLILPLVSSNFSSVLYYIFNMQFS